MNLRHALPGSTARQLFNSSTLLDSSTARQTSTDLDRPRHPGTCSQSLDLPRQARQLLDSYSTAGQLLDSYSTGSTGKALTAPRQRPRQRLDGASTARQPGLNDDPGTSRSCRGEPPSAIPIDGYRCAPRDPRKRVCCCRTSVARGGVARGPAWHISITQHLTQHDSSSSSAESVRQQHPSHDLQCTNTQSITSRP